MMIIGKIIKFKKRICNRIFPFQNTSHKIVKKKQNKINQTHYNGESILRYHLCFLVVTVLYQRMNFSKETKKKKSSNKASKQIVLLLHLQKQKI